MKDTCDVAVIGAGLAGLTAAYFMARSGLDVAVFERQPVRGYLDHPCGRMFAPVRGFIHVEAQADGGFFYPEAEFWFSPEVIAARPTTMQFVAPNGCTFGMDAGGLNSDISIFQIRKGLVLKMLADRAESAGARLHYGAEVSRLYWEGDNVRGVFLGDQKVEARIVVSAEGHSRTFANEAGLYSSQTSDKIVLATRFVEQLPQGHHPLGQWAYFGQHLGTLPHIGLVFHTIGQEAAMAILMALNPPADSIERLIAYLDTSIEQVDWIKEIVASGQTAAHKINTLLLQKPHTLVANGYLGVGDCVAPYGHSSNAIAMYMGAEGAKVVLNAFKKGDFSAEVLKPHNRFLRSLLFGGVEFEGRLIARLLQMTDDERNRLCACFSGVNLAPFFVGTPGQQMWAICRLMFRPAVLQNWRLVRRLLT